MRIHSEFEYNTPLIFTNEVLRVQGTELKDFVIDKIDDLKAKNITVLDVSKQSTITDTMIICTGTSKTHVRSIGEHVIVSAKDAGVQPLGVEGRDSSEWVLVDLGPVILHVMQEQTRDYYELEKLWSEHSA
ncbi:ribosomal silencing factor RsfS [Shewanella saliphila]|uniref:Ribosomal silencing factor RsfS n=1 Tax=Shewanella saliphila TaxID=2282698 RepID=A0ABQ2Q5Q7_9GAMM|nr:ribosome silencing factor [Shewanella saliphila]GGP52962.1 ribosomal silencing factor RsfS [Shewanella saliphila]